MQRNPGEEMNAVPQADLGPSGASKAQPGEDPPFIWRNCWYPVSFLQDLPRDRPTAFTLYDEPFVLFFDGAGRLSCLKDRCPHRAARLSDGQIIDGRLECLYHGWQFGEGGQCLLIPQLYPDKDIPERAHVVGFKTVVAQNIVWVWPGDTSLVDEALVPRPPHHDMAAIHSVTFQMDLPYDQTYLIENVIDVAHIHIAHDGVRGGGRRAAAKPLDFQILKSDVTGIRGTFRSVGRVREEGNPALDGASVEFVAPNLIRYASKYHDPGLVAGLDLYSLPLGKNKCRLLYQKYSNFTSVRERIKPRWLEHLTQCTILEQDMAVVVGQHEQIERDGAQLRDIWFPLKTSDRLVLEYRKWLDRFGGELPFHRGFATAHNSGPDRTLAKLPVDRHVLHTKICATCNRLHKSLGRSVAALWVFVALAGLAALFIDSGGGRVAVGILVAAALLTIAGARALQSRL